MRALTPLIIGLALLAGSLLRPGPALAACAQDAAGRCQSAGACSPPAEGKCTTVVANPLSGRQYGCRCLTTQTWGPSANGPTGACRQRCSTTNVTCESGARTNTQRSQCASRDASCYSHCE
jgi:hypothetical protein